MAIHINAKSAAELERELRAFRRRYASSAGELPPPTWPRLAICLGTTWQTLNTPEKAIPPGTDEREAKAMAALLAAAKAEFEADEVDKLYQKDLARGAVFALKNLFGWKDRSETETAVDGGIDVVLSGGIDQYSG